MNRLFTNRAASKRAAGVACLMSAAMLGAGTLGASAQTGVYVPPKLVSRGEPGTSVPGPGSVIVKVLVKADGSFQVQNVIRSTNHADDQVALDIATHSTYKPALRAGKSTTAFYDYTLAFTNTGVAPAADSAQSIAAVFPYEQMIRAGKYQQAKAGLQGYLAKHPTDTRALTFLGVASEFLGDTPGAVAAFDKVAVIPDKYKAIAIKAYGDDVTALGNSKQYSAAIPVAKRALALQPGAPAYDNLAFVELGAGDTASAITDFGKARAAATGAPATQRATIDANLATAYAKSGDLDNAKTYAAEAKQLDPTQTAGYAAMENTLADQADVANKAAKYADAAALYEQAAAVAPKDAVTLYTNAAFANLQLKTTVGYDAAKADADKALALDAGNAGANFAEGLALADEGKHDEALTFLNKADVAAKAGTDPSLTANIEAVLKQVNGPSK